MFYAWPITMTAGGLRIMAREMLRVLEGFEATQLAAYGFGAVPLMSATLLAGEGRYTGLVVRPERKAHGALRQVDGCGVRPGRVVLLDDALSSGKSFTEACRVLEDEGFDVEGTACVVEFPYRGGRDRASARGFRVAAMFDIWDDLGMAAPPKPPAFVRSLPARWSRDVVPAGLTPATAARLVAEHFVATGQALRPPESFDTDQDGRGGVFVSLRRRSDDHRLARRGFWHFEAADADPCRDLVIATVQTVESMRSRPRAEPLGDLKLGVTFFGPLERVAPSELDFFHYGVVVRSRVVPGKMGGALPNTQFFTSTYEQYRHARWTNAKIPHSEPHDVFRHRLTKCVEAGSTWPRYGEDIATTDGWLDVAGLGERVLGRAHEIIEALGLGREIPASSLLSEALAGGYVDAVAVSLYDRGVIGCTVSALPNLDDALVRAARGALRDPRFAQRAAGEASPAAVVVSLLHSRERLGAVSMAYLAKKLRRGRDAFSVGEGKRYAIFLDSVPVHYNWTETRAAEALLRKARIETPTPVVWTTHKVRSWLGTGGDVHELENGFARRSHRRELGDDELILMAEHLVRRVDLNGWPAYQVIALNGSLQRRGTAARCLHALMLLDSAGRRADRPDWVRTAASGIDYAVARLGDAAAPELALRDHTAGPVAEAMLLAAVSGSRHAALGSPAVAALASKIRAWVRPDGSVRLPGATTSRAEQDFLPSVTLIGLVSHALATGTDPGVDWDAIRVWYRRRARLIGPWGLLAWQAQVWRLVGELTGDPAHHETATEFASWMVDGQLTCDGSFLTDMYAAGPSFHTAFAAEGVAAGWRSAIVLGDDGLAARFAQSWHRAMSFMEQLIVRREDTFWMADPTVAVGAIRCAPASSDLRVDFTSHTMVAVISGLDAIESASR